MPLELKTTKEIAREAVEEEYQRRKNKSKRKRGQDEDYDSSDSEDKNHKRKRKGDATLMPRQVGGARNRNQKEEDDDESDFEPSQDYRDRAQERREGKEEDAAAADDDAIGNSKKSSSNNTPTTSSSSWAHQAKQKWQQEQLNKDGSKDGTGLVDTLQPFETKQEAETAIFELLDTPVGRRFRSCLEQTIASHPVSVDQGDNNSGEAPLRRLTTTSSSSNHRTAIIRSIHETRLVMTSHDNVANPFRVWEHPREVLVVRSSSHKHNTDTIMPDELRNRIQSFWDRRRRPQRLPPKRSKPKSSAVSKASSDHQISMSNTVEAKQDPHALENDDDDDDIFGGLDAYVPPTSQTTTSTGT